MSQDELKRRVAQSALNRVLPLLEAGTIVGIGTGSTANHFIDLLAAYKDRFYGAVASSEASAVRLRAAGVRVLSLGEALERTPTLPVYVDGADEVNPALQMLKGGGGALTREKIVAAASDVFVCIVDGSKTVPVLGKFPLPVEVIPMARTLVARALTALGGRPILRHGFVTDNGNEILDVHDLRYEDAVEWEKRLNNLPGVVTVGLFALRPADLLLVGREHAVEQIENPKGRSLNGRPAQ